MTKIIKCAFCSGTGKDPYDLLSQISSCQVCNGTGETLVMEPANICVFCAGTGKNPLGARVSCIVCGGKGLNHCDKTSKCNKCQGSGKSIDGLPCTRCRGIGYN